LEISVYFEQQFFVVLLMNFSFSATFVDFPDDEFCLLKTSLILLNNFENRVSFTISLSHQVLFSSTIFCLFRIRVAEMVFFSSSLFR